MSVINQMLKDLEKRNNDGNQPNVIHVPSSKEKSSKGVIVFAIAISVIMTLLVTYLISLRQENNELKVNAKSEVRDTNVVPLSASTPEELPEIKSEPIKLEPKKVIQENTLDHNIMLAADTHAIETNMAEPENNTIAEAAKHQLPPQAQTKNSEQAKTTPQKTTPDPAPPSSLSISRKQFTPEQLASQKMKKAEKAMMDKDLMQAEALFGDVLLLLPNDITARKQLAALWFGRQQYQDALNLLSRGIELAPADTEFRLMQARIYLTQQHNEAAFLVLSSLNNAPDVEYQSLLANTAQALSKFEDAEKAYTLLVTMQPQQSRWHLGLAIALDKQSKFDKAIAAYKSAITLGGLSNSTMQFAVQRIKDLGE